MSNKLIRRAALLGAGVMGAQIAAHLAAAGVDTLLFDLPKDDGDANALANRALAGLKKLKPPPLASQRVLGALTACNYRDDLERLADCDLVIEAIAERMDWKKDLYDQVSPHIGADCIIATNTSGLGINELASVLPERLRSRFCGVHFFNPPRYMHLAEVIPGNATSGDVLDRLETFLTSDLGKGVVRAKDTPNFIANRVGMFSMLAAMQHTVAQGLGFDQVDALTGTAIGRAKSATYRTADIVGLDTMGHVIGTMAEQLPDDPWHRHFGLPDWLSKLIDNGQLGQKSAGGIYRKQGRQILVLDLASGEYRESGQAIDPQVSEILAQRDPVRVLPALRASQAPEAKFLWACYRDLFHYCAVQLADIAGSVRDVDLAMRWGYGWRQGPFETWQAAGWQQIAGWIREDIANGSSLSDQDLPDWVDSLADDGPYGEGKAYSAADGQHHPRSALPVYQRQRFPDPVLGEQSETGNTLYENDGVRLWEDIADIGILGFKSKMNTLGPAVIEGALAALDHAEANLAAVVIWQGREPFSVGADLMAAAEMHQSAGPAAVAEAVRDFQHFTGRLRSSSIPTIAAVRGMALGGGCEILLHCDRTVAALESYIGLVEVGVGLLPAGGGLKELALRCWQEARGTDVFPRIQQAFQLTAMGKVSASALEAREWGLLGPADPIVFHAHEILHVACAQARAMADSGYRPPLTQRDISVAGRVGVANLKMMMVNMLEGHFISEHDMAIGSRIAECLCGGDVDGGSQVDEEWLLRLERENFLTLLASEQTQQRIAHMLKTGKPLRN
jgi:3-hydroxyacyl-CoA dehydrogenase